MKQSALRSVFFFQRMVIGLDNYKGKESLSRVVVHQAKYGIMLNSLMVNYLILMMDMR